MRCPSCDHDNRAERRFCAECGTALAARCTTCGASNEPGEKFCGGCGTRLRPTPAAPGAPPPVAELEPTVHSAERRQLTVMFCDLVGSTDLSQRLDAEDLRSVVRAYQEAASRAVDRYAGHIAQYLGDGLLVYFGYPQAHEDAAERAVRAGLEVVQGVKGLAVRTLVGAGASSLTPNTLSVRIGIHTGPVVIGAMGGGAKSEVLALGDTTNIAARLEAVAAADTVVISGATQRLVPGLFLLHDLGTPPLKGIATPIRAHAVLQATGVRSRLDVDPRTLTPLVGRDQELGLLIARWEQAQECNGQAVLIAGEAGLGKSRLLQALRERLSETPHTWLECRCTPYTQGSAFHPLIELVEQGLGFKADDDPETKLRAGSRPGLRRRSSRCPRWCRSLPRCSRCRDVERFAALHPPALRYRDHRRLVQLDLDREGFLAFTRSLLEMRSTSASLDLLATRGEHLALMRSTLEMADDAVGPSAIDSLLLIETGERDEIVAYDRYEIDDEETARTEIQARWESGEGAHLPIVTWMRDHAALVGRRDWDALATLYSPAVVGHDHRLVGWGTLRGRTDFLQSLRSMEALSPDARMRGDHTRVCPRGSIISSMWVGTRDGGAFESRFLVVSELDPDGKVVRIDFYDPHHFDRARARFEEIAAEPNPPAPFPAREGGMEPLAALVKPNLATASMERGWAAFDNLDLDLDAARLHFVPDFLWEDRRPIVGLSGGLDLMLASARERIASGARHERRTIVGTAGDRVAIARVLWAGGPPDGRFEVEFLVVHEVNEAGLCTALIFFDPDDERAAQREAWARWAAIEPVAAPWVELVNEFTDAWNGHDRARVRACFAVVIEDHRHAGLGRIEGAEAYVDSIVVLWDLAPDQRLMFGWSWPVVERHGIVVTIRREGTVPDGGPFETEHLALGLARNGRFTRVEFFEIDALVTALARFEELQPGTRQENE